MTTKRYALEAGGAPRVEVSGRYGFKDVVVKLDGIEIGRIATAAELKMGRDFALPDSSTMRLQLNTQIHARELLVLRNGQPLPGSSSHPATIHRGAYGVLYAIAGFTAIFGVLAIASTDSKLGGTAGGIGMLAEAAIYAILAWRVSRQSLIALYIALVLFVADTVLSISDGSAHGIIVRILVFVALIRGIPAIRELRRTSGPPPITA